MLYIETITIPWHRFKDDMPEPNREIVIRPTTIFNPCQLAGVLYLSTNRVDAFLRESRDHRDWQWAYVDEIKKKPRSQGGAVMKKRHTGISEKAFVKAVRELYPNALFHGLDEKDSDDVWIRGIGYWEAERVLYSRSDKNIRMWRNFGGWDRHFKNLDAFKKWLNDAYANNRKFEETSEVK